MELPQCPVCREGRLVPVSESDTAYAHWICIMPDCSYAISNSIAGTTYYKGMAAAKDKEKGGKKWIEFRF